MKQLAGRRTLIVVLVTDSFEEGFLGKINFCRLGLLISYLNKLIILMPSMISAGMQLTHCLIRLLQLIYHLDTNQNNITCLCSHEIKLVSATLEKNNCISSLLTFSYFGMVLTNWIVKDTLCNRGTIHTQLKHLL